jgi:glycosyltransferase involved in cell wall biosynthesis
LAGVLLGAYFKKPVVVSARGSDINRLRTFPVMRRLLRCTLTKADRIIAVSDALKRAMIGLGILDSKISVIPNGVDGKKFRRFPQAEARSLLGLGPHKLILSVGNLTANKGFDLLIKAVSALRDDRPRDQVHLVIVGEGECRHRLETLVAALDLGAHVRLVGGVPHERLYLWYSAADVFCLASEREGWPNVLMEALACGTPVVATPVGGIPEIIVSEEIGLLTERQEVKIAAAIRKALDHQWRPERLIQYVRAHTWERVALDMHQVFASTLACGKKRPAHGSPRYGHKIISEGGVVDTGGVALERVPTPSSVLLGVALNDVRVPGVGEPKM